MAIRFHPRELAEKLLPDKAVKKLVTKRLTLNRATLNILSRADILTKPTLEKVALKVIKGYKAAYEDQRDSGATVAEATEEAVNEQKLMLSRVQGAAAHEIAKEVKNQYHGEFYTWLPSDANEPDPLHQLNYGKTFQIGVGEAPGDRYGCQCGMEIQVDESQLKL